MRDEVFGRMSPNLFLMMRMTMSLLFALHPQPPQTMRRLPSFTLFLVLPLFFLLNAVESTDVKWTEGEHDTNNKAHTAPKSQKYWDEHGIERPDYAKTDAEIAQERGGGSTSGNIMKWILLLPVLVAAGYYFYVQMGGHRLGGAGSHLFCRKREEEARQARLAKFEQAVGSGKAE